MQWESEKGREKGRGNITIFDKLNPGYSNFCGLILPPGYRLCRQGFSLPFG